MFRKRKRRIPGESPRGGGRSPSEGDCLNFVAAWGMPCAPDSLGDDASHRDRRFSNQTRPPTQAEIRRECRKIRRKWSPSERLRRKVARRRSGWMPPTLAMAELQEILIEDQANGRR